MKILGFIKSSFFLLLLSQSVYSSDYSEEYKIANTKWSISSVCSDSNGTICNVFAKSQGRLEKITEFPNVPSNIKMESDIISIGFPCGVGCSAFYVYRLGGGLIGPFPRIESIDYEKKIAYVISGNSYELYKITTKPHLIKKVKSELKEDDDLLNKIIESRIDSHIFSSIYEHDGKQRKITINPDSQE